MSDSMVSRLVERYKSGVIFSCVLVGMGLVLLAGSYFYYASSLEEETKSLRMLKSAQQKYRTATTNFNQVSEIYNDFTGLINSGFVGDEQRLQWIATVNQIVNEEKIPRVEFSAVKKEHADILNYSNFQSIFVSTTTMRLYLLHEADLFTVFQRLTAEVSGVYLPAKCDISPLSAEYREGLEYTANLLAICTISWFSVQLTDEAMNAFNLLEP